MTTTTPDPLKVLEGVELHGQINVSDPELLENVAHSIRLGHPQVRPQAIQGDRVLLVGGGPSLASTEQELIEAYLAGGKIFALNGAAQWCLERNLRPSAQIVLDARAANARFVSRPIPQCRYLLASQCHPAVWAAVADRPDVWIWHAAAPEGGLQALLDAYYLEMWTPIAGGTTAAMRGLALLRTLGYVRFTLFGIDSCWLGAEHHAYPQAENQRDQRIPVRVYPSEHPELERAFLCAPWHMKQAEDFLQLVRLHGDQFLLDIRGDGLLAFMLKASADVVIETRNA